MPKLIPPKDEETAYPMRINKYLAHCKFASRRQADHLIEKGYVTINTHRAVVGDKVNEGDMVEVDTEVMKKKRQNDIYIAYHKPIGVVSHSPEKGQRGIEEIFNFNTRLFPMGRLDQNSHGLIILTNDGRITKKLLEPKYEHEKEYEIMVDKALNLRDIKRMADGVALDDFTTKPAKVEKLSEKKFRIILTEGKKHQIRRMCEALGYKVIDLCRMRIMHIQLGSLIPGRWRRIEGAELAAFLREVI
ncbi:MAG: pseudouridine synthase [bacterium]|nr:pseudouridine synthase [bacterium]